MIKYNYIAIEGVIGAGKTALSEKIAKDYNTKLILEQFEENSFLPLFYKDPEKYAFPLEMSFMASRFQQLKNELLDQDLFKSFTISDYLFDKSKIFAKVTLPKNEFHLFSKFFDFLSSSIPKPDLLLYLYRSAENLKKNIDRRGRPYEKNIQSSYLEQLQFAYLKYFNFLNGVPIIVMDTNELDFVKNEKDYEIILNTLKKEYSPGISRIRI